MPPAENENQELDLVSFAAGLIRLLKRKAILVFVLICAGLLSGFIISNTGSKPGKDFYKQEFVITSICPVDYLYDVSKSVAVKLIQRNPENLRCLKSIEPNLKLSELKESRLIISVSAFDSAAIHESISAFHKELTHHQGLKMEYEKQRVIKAALLEELNQKTDFVCKDADKMLQHCFSMLKQQAAIKTELVNTHTFEINIIDSSPVLVSRHNERNLLLTGTSLLGLLAGLIISFLLEFYSTAGKKSS